MLSIIIPALNEEERLPLLLNSIKIQNFSDYEIIIADAGSTDKTIEVAKKYGCRISTGGMPGKGRNEGAKIAKGGLFLFLDADVLLPHDLFISNALKEFEKRGLDLACFTFVPASEKIIGKFAFLVWNGWLLITQKFFPHGASGFLVKREAHMAAGGFDEQIFFAEDQSYVAAVKKKGKFRIIRKEPIIVSTRRFEKDGWANTFARYFLADLYLFFIGPIKSDIFKYRFNHYHENKNRKK